MAAELEPCAFAVAVPESAGWTSFLHLCIGEGLPQASMQGSGLPGGSGAPLETNLVEPPVWNIIMNIEGILQNTNNALVRFAFETKVHAVWILLIIFYDHIRGRFISYGIKNDGKLR